MQLDYLERFCTPFNLEKKDSLVLKAYDKVNWGMIRLILLHISLPLLVCNWIMACVSSTPMVVLNNGTFSIFFKT